VGSCRHALEAMGRTAPPHHELLWIIGPPLRQTFAALLGEGGDTEAAVAHYRTRYADGALFEATPYPGIAEALDELRGAGHRLMVCTAKATVFAERIIEHFGFSPAFEAVFGAELGGRFDDKGDLIAHILERHGRDGEAVCMIGDRRHDVAAAARHGLPTIGALWGYGGEAELRDAGAISLCARPSDLPDQVAAALRS
jgi:phosphoglycolate phosphatase